MIDIFSLETPAVSTNLSGKSFFIYGAAKTGKTSNAIKFPKPLIVGFEKGWNMLFGEYKAQSIGNWRDALEVRRQLLNDAKAVENKQKAETHFQTIILDTVSIAYDMCTAYILGKEGLEYLDETPMMRGYKAVQKEFSDYVNSIVKAGYTLIAIAHEETKTYKKNNIKYEVIQPIIDKRGMEILTGLCDVIGYAHTIEEEDGKQNVMLRLRATDDIVAGTRSRFMSELIPFTYQALLDDMTQAMEKEKELGGAVVEQPTQVYKDQHEVRDYKEVKAEINTLGKAIAKVTGTKETVSSIVAKYLGRDSEDKQRTVASCTEAQIQQLELICLELRDLAKELNIE